MGCDYLPAGRFTKGNPGGPGNPMGRRVAELRHALMDAVSQEDVHALNMPGIEKLDATANHQRPLTVPRPEPGPPRQGVPSTCGELAARRQSRVGGAGRDHGIRRGLPREQAELMAYASVVAMFIGLDLN